MANFKTYTLLSKLSDELNSITDVNGCYSIAWNKVNTIVDALLEDVYLISKEHAYVKEVKFIFNDPTYRQSASACLIEVKFLQDEDFVVLAECLIDHQRIWLKVRQRPSNLLLMDLANRIETKYNQEFLSELKSLA